MPDAGILATLLLLVGLFLLGLEFFIPSFGMILIVAVLSLIISFWSACKAWWGVSPWFFWTYIALLTVGVPGTLMGAIALIQKSSLGKRMILRPTPTTETSDSVSLKTLVGKRGTSQSLMTPGGIVLIDGERIHAESIGMLIEPNIAVIVVATKGSRIVVRPCTERDMESEHSSVVETATNADPPLADFDSESEQEPNRLDFDIPED